LLCNYEEYYCCVIKKNVIVASWLYDVADVQFTVD